MLQIIIILPPHYKALENKLRVCRTDSFTLEVIFLFFDLSKSARDGYSYGSYGTALAFSIIFRLLTLHSER